MELTAGDNNINGAAKWPAPYFFELAMAIEDSTLLDFGTPAIDLKRDVYCVLGLPIDALDMPSILRRIDAAAASRTPFLISTPNLNFLVNSRSDPEFRDSVLNSDLCPADGMPIVWIARLIGVSIRQRVSGADIFEALKIPDRNRHQLKVFLFGGASGVAEEAARTLNAVPCGLTCVGALGPGIGTVEELSRNTLIDKVNASDADFLAVSLGAKKGQLWLHRNRKRLTIPIRVHLGAVLNFQAGTINRAPPILRACGLEWLWRIKEEPHLWRRYLHDSWALLRLVISHIVPLAIINRWYRFKSQHLPQDFLIRISQSHDSVTVGICGDAIDRYIGKAISRFRETLTRRKAAVVIDLSDTRVIDGRFFGLLLMLRKHLNGREEKLIFIGAKPAIRRMFRLNGVGFLLSSE